MGNTQGPHKRERYDSGNRKSTIFCDDDQHPFELKIAKSSPSASTHSMQYMNTNEYPVVIKWNSNTYISTTTDMLCNRCF